jgi:hypothetical protein
MPSDEQAHKFFDFAKATEEKIKTELKNKSSE